MGDTRQVLFVSARPRVRAAVERFLPAHGPLDVTAVAGGVAALDVLSETSIDCVAVEHADSGDTTETDSARRRIEAVGQGTDSTVARGSAEQGTDALHVLRLVRDTDPAVPVVIYETAGATSVASDAISLDVTEYVRESDAADPLEALASVCHDASATYRAQQDVAMLNDLARNVYERITDGFFALDQDWRFTYVNEAAEEIMEVDGDEVLGETLWDVFPGTVGTNFYSEYHRAMAAQEPVTFREYYPPLEKTFDVRAFPSEDGLSVHFRTAVDDEDVERSDHLLELTNVLSADLLDSIDALREDLEDAQASAGDVAEIEGALESVDRLQSLVNYSIRLANEHPTPSSGASE